MNLEPIDDHARANMLASLKMIGEPYEPKGREASDMEGLILREGDMVALYGYSALEAKVHAITRDYLVDIEVSEGHFLVTPKILNLKGQRVKL